MKFEIKFLQTLKPLNNVWFLYHYYRGVPISCFVPLKEKAAKQKEKLRKKRLCEMRETLVLAGVAGLLSAAVGLFVYHRHGIIRS